MIEKVISIKDRIAKLIDLKSIITIILVGVLAWGFIAGKITSEQYIPLVTMVLTFYFVKKDKKED